MSRLAGRPRTADRRSSRPPGSPRRPRLRAIDWSKYCSCRIPVTVAEPSGEIHCTWNNCFWVNSRSGITAAQAATVARTPTPAAAAAYASTATACAGTIRIRKTFSTAAPISRTAYTSHHHGRARTGRAARRTPSTPPRLSTVRGTGSPYWPYVTRQHREHQARRHRDRATGDQLAENHHTGRRYAGRDRAGQTR